MCTVPPPTAQAGCLRKRLPLRGAGAERLRGVTAPKACRRVAACAEGADAPPPFGRHTSPSRLRRATSPRGEALGPRRLRGKAPLEGSWRGAPERCYRTESLPLGIGVCRRALARRRRCAAAHLSVTLRVPPPLKGRLWEVRCVQRTLPRFSKIGFVSPQNPLDKSVRLLYG